MKNELKGWISYLRKHYGKKNGVIPGWAMDDPRMEVKCSRSKKNYKRNPKHRGMNYHEDLYQGGETIVC